MSVTISLDYKTSTSIRVKAQSNYWGAKTFEWYLDGNYVGSYTGTNRGDGYYYHYKTFSGLDPCSEHRMTCYLYGDDGAMHGNDYYTTSTSSVTPYNPGSVSTSVDGKSIYFTWTKGADATSTKIKIDGSTTTHTGTSATRTVSNYSTSYPYEIWSYNSYCGTSSTGVTGSVTSGADPDPDPITLSTPSAPLLDSGGRGSTSLAISWGSVSNASSYTVKYVNGTTTNTKTTTSTSTTLTNLISGTSYSLSVKANGDGVNYLDSSYSSTNTATTKCGTPTISEYSKGATWITIYVDDPSGNYDGIRVEQGSDTRTITSSGTLHYSGLSPSTSYSFYAQAYLDSSSVLDSNWDYESITTLNQTTLSAPTNLVFDSRSNDSLSLHWDGVTNNSGYTIRAVGGNETITASVNKDVSSGTVSGLKGGTTYDITVKTEGDGTEYLDSSYSTEVLVSTTKCDTPTLTYSSSTSSSLTFYASGTDNFDGIWVRRKDLNKITVEAISTTGGYVTFSNLPSDTEYYVDAYSYIDGKSVTDSTSTTDMLVRTQAVPPPDPTVTHSSTTSSITWNYSSDGATEYNLVVDDVTITGRTETSYTLSGLSSNELHTFSVQAVGSTGLTSNYVSHDAYTSKIKPTAPTIDSISVSGKTATIDFTHGANTSTTKIATTWDYSTSPESGITQYVVTAPDYSVTYGFVIWAYSVDGESASTSGEFTTDGEPLPTSPANFRVSSKGVTSISLAWDEVTSHCVGYNVYCDGVKQNSSLITGTTYTVSGLSEYTIYDFLVYGVNSEGNEGTQSYLQERTSSQTPLAPTSITASNIDIYSFDLAWTQSDLAHGYKIYINGTLNKTITSGSTLSTSITGLSPKTDYIACIESYRNDVVSDTKTCTDTITTLSDRPNDWTWTTDFSLGVLAYKIDGIWYADMMPHTEWNNFTNRINAFRDYKGLSNYSFTTVSDGTTFTATIFNQAVSSINAMGFSISTVSSGNNFTDEKFLELSNTLNSIT